MYGQRQISLYTWVFHHSFKQSEIRWAVKGYSWEYINSLHETSSLIYRVGLGFIVWKVTISSLVPIHYVSDIRSIQSIISQRYGHWTNHGHAPKRLAHSHFSQGFPPQMDFPLLSTSGQTNGVQDKERILTIYYLIRWSLLLLFMSLSFCHVQMYLWFCFSNFYRLHTCLREIRWRRVYLYLLLIFQLSSVSTSRGNIGVCLWARINFGRCQPFRNFPPF